MSAGIRLIDKPVGFTSFQIVSIFKRHYRKVGHAGTLDPFASGLLIVLIGSATKNFLSYQKCNKEYIGEMVLGMVTDSYDIAGQILKERWNGNREGYTLHDLNQIASSFVGEIEQVPPIFSAIKQDGVKLYELSRQGIVVQPKKRRVMIVGFTITAVEYPILHFHTLVGSGVYVRSLVFEYGNRLGCGATLISLRRTKIGDDSVKTARKIGEI